MKAKRVFGIVLTFAAIGCTVGVDPSPTATTEQAAKKKKDQRECGKYYSSAQVSKKKGKKCDKLRAVITSSSDLCTPNCTAQERQGGLEAAQEQGRLKCVEFCESHGCPANYEPLPECEGNDSKQCSDDFSFCENCGDLNFPCILNLNHDSWNCHCDDFSDGGDGGDSGDGDAGDSDDSGDAETDSD